MAQISFRLTTWLHCILIASAGNAIAGVLKPGDSSYPAIIARPSFVIPAVLTGPEWVGMQLLATYVSDATPPCGHEIFGAGRFPYDVQLPINMTRAGDGYRGSVVVDRFDPGNCHWRFTGISYGGWKEGVWNSLAIVAVAGGGSPTVPDPKIDFWCYRVTYQEKSMRNCEELASLRWSNAMRAVSPAFLSQFSAEERGNLHPIRITTQTKSIRVNLHDLNAIQGALIPVGDLQAQVARAKADKAAALETAGRQ
jgi:hypothetical protein